MKCILTGLGGRGRHWLSILNQRDDVEVVAAVEPFETNRQRAIDDNAIDAERIFPTLEEAIAKSNADFVMDVTPPKVHHEIALQAFASGLHVLGEKPLSDDFETARKVVQAGKSAGVTHMITQNYRFGAQPRTTRQVLADGLIGKPGQCDVRFAMPWADQPGSHYVTEPYMMINDMMVHHFDLMRYVLNDTPQTIQAITWNQPWGWHQGDSCHAIVVEWKSGLHATHVCIACANGSQTSWNGDWSIQGPNGSIDWDKEGTWHSHLHRTDNKVERQRIAHLDVKPQAEAMVDEFFDSIRENREPECSAQDNLQSLAMVFSAIESAQSGRKVEIARV